MPGDYIWMVNRTSHIGTQWDHNNQNFKGLIDWLSWKPYADYDGVVGGPN